jgi:hypothetical protein
MKKNLKIILIVVILFLAGIAAVLGVRVAKTYLGGAEAGTEPKNVRIQAESNSATISWQTDKEAIGVVEYGTNQASLLLRGPETTAATTHKVSLSPLKADTTYYFRIRIGELIYDNNGIPYSFKTKPAETAVTITQTPSPFPTISPPAATPSVGKESTSSGALVTKCDADEFKTKMGGSDMAYDFDNNGIVNTKDWLECLKKNNK